MVAGSAVFVKGFLQLYAEVWVEAVPPAPALNFSYFFFWFQSEVTRRKEEMEAMKAAELDALEGPLQRHEISQDDHPLSLGSKSVWHQFFQVFFFNNPSFGSIFKQVAYTGFAMLVSLASIADLSFLLMTSGY